MGLVGGVASGKSFVASLLCELGAVRLDADRAGHQVLENPKIRAAIRDRWGSAVFNAQGEVRREALAERVFAETSGGQQDRQFLERLTHPAIQLLLEEQAHQALRDGAKVLVLDAPLLLEAGWDRLCSEIWFVDCPRPTRLQRARGRGWTESQLAAREAAQFPVESKRQRAVAVIDNGKDPSHTRQQILALWRRLSSSTIDA